MKSLFYTSLVLASTIFLTGCEKYVDIKTQGQLTPGTIENYRLLLNNTSVFEVAPSISDMASDDLEIEDGSAQQLSLTGDYYGYYYRSYQWSDEIYSLGSQYYKDDNWGNLYNAIAYANTIIAEVPDATDGTLEQKEALIAEAKIHRAAAYLMLVNTYAKPYRAETASSDLGVPLVLKPTTEQSLSRPSLQEIYDAIVSDIETALLSLPTTQAFNTLPSKASAYALLARTYLYMNSYDLAKTAADNALALRKELIDLTAIQEINSDSYPLRIKNPEILFSKTPIDGITAYSSTALRLSPDLLSLFDTNDQRYNLFTVPGTIISDWDVYEGRYFYLDYYLQETRNVGPSVPEMLLIKAEVEARNNNISAAMELVNQLRRKRILTTGLVDLTATDKNDALVKVINERRREFMFRMLRWWDMRRLKDDSLFQKTYTRTFGGEKFTLTPNSNRYVFPIAKYELNLNKEIQPNP